MTMHQAPRTEVAWCLAGNPPQPMDGNHLSAEMYKGALDLLSRGRVTHQEMSISLGSKVAPVLEQSIGCCGAAMPQHGSEQYMLRPPNRR